MSKCQIRLFFTQNCPPKKPFFYDFYIIQKYKIIKQEGHDGPGSLTWVIFPTNEFYIFVPLIPICDPRVGPVLIPRGIK